MALTILNQINRLSWSLIASVGLHASLVVGLFYTTVPSVSLPSVVEQPVTVMMIMAESQKLSLSKQPVESQHVALKDTLESGTGSVLERPLPVQVPKLVPKIKSKSESGRIQEIRPQIQTSRSKMHLTGTHVTRAPISGNVKGVSNMPRATLRTNPIYPLRAIELGIEGIVSVMYDVNVNGRVENIRIVSAQPRYVFERDIRLAMHQWIYEAGKPAANMTVNFKFDFERVKSTE